MSDKVPLTIRVSQATVRWRISEQETALAASRTQILELIDRHTKNVENITKSASDMKRMKEEASKTATPLDRARLKASLASMENNVARQEVENLEGLERIIRIGESVEAAGKSLASYRKQLDDLNKAHGPLTDEIFAILRRSIDDD